MSAPWWGLAYPNEKSVLSDGGQSPQLQPPTRKVVVDALKARIPAYTPEWTRRTAGDAPTLRASCADPGRHCAAPVPSRDSRGCDPAHPGFRPLFHRLRKVSYVVSIRFLNHCPASGVAVYACAAPVEVLQPCIDVESISCFEILQR